MCYLTCKSMRLFFPEKFRILHIMTKISQSPVGAAYSIWVCALHLAMVCTCPYCLLTQRPNVNCYLASHICCCFPGSRIKKRILVFFIYLLNMKNKLDQDHPVFPLILLLLAPSIILSLQILSLEVLSGPTNIYCLPYGKYCARLIHKFHVILSTGL